MIVKSSAAIYTYDNTFEGLLTVIFEIYATKIFPAAITSKNQAQAAMFAEVRDVPTDEEKAGRVFKKINALEKRLGRVLFKVFLSEKSEREMLIYRLVSELLSRGRFKKDFRDPAVLRAKQILKEVNREVHRMHAFVRFRRMADDLWVATVEPDFDVLPLIGIHFEKRYADQRWLIYDLKRSYGIYYDLEQTDYVEMKMPAGLTSDPALLHDEEKAYGALWKDYFDSVNIKARNNPQLHLRHLPRRYWKYLTEKSA